MSSQETEVTRPLNTLGLLVGSFSRRSGTDCVGEASARDGETGACRDGPNSGTNIFFDRRVTK